MWGCFSIDAPVPSCLNYCRFRVSPDNWYVFWLSTLFFKIELFSFSFLFFNLSWHSILVYNTLVTLDLLHFLTNLKSAFFGGEKELAEVFFIGITMNLLGKMEIFTALTLSFWSFYPTQLGVAMKWEVIIRSWDCRIPCKVSGILLYQPPLGSLPW